MVTWAKLQALKQTMAGGEPPCLVMNGVRYDNATRDLLEQKGDGYDNNDRIFTVATRSEDDFRDFVWFRRRVRIAGPFHTGGHPFLAGFRGIYCAGRVARGMFDFHSGHYHPKLRNVVYYMYEFIENSCQNLQGMQRDQKVDELCKIPLELYYDDSETEKYATTFKRILSGGKLERDYGARNTMTMGESRLHPKYGQSSGSAISFNSTQSIVKLGVTPHVPASRNISQAGPCKLGRRRRMHEVLFLQKGILVFSSKASLPTVRVRLLRRMLGQPKEADDACHQTRRRCGNRTRARMRCVCPNPGANFMALTEKFRP